MKNHILAILCTTILLSMFCGDPIPVEEMSNAKYEIAKAESVKAEKYAPAEYEAAKKALFESHDLIAKEELGDAKQKAIESKEQAEKAFKIAAPKLAEDTKKEAETAITEADEAFAEEFAATEFSKAKAMSTKGDELFEKADYVAAFQSYEEAREEAKKARNISEAQAEIMKRDIAQIEDTIEQAEKFGAGETAAQPLAAAKASLQEAKENVGNIKLKVAYGQINAAKENANQALDIAQKDWANKKHQEATEAVSKADGQLAAIKKELETNEEMKKTFSESTEAQESLRSIEESFTAAQSSLSSADKSLQASSYETSYNQSEEAIRLSKIVEDQAPQISVMLAEYKKRQLEEEQKRIEEEQKNQENNTETTETNTTETNTVTKKEEQPLAEGWKSYKVRLIPQRRDCLWRIAGYDFIYGKSKLWPRIYKANKGKIKNPDLIYPGQVFDIPPKTGNTEKPTNTTKEEGKAAEDKVINEPVE